VAGGLDLYEGVKIEWMRGFDPALHIYGEDGVETTRISLKDYKYDGLHALFAKHFKLKAGGLAPAVGVKSRSLSALASAHEAAAPDPGNRRAAAETAEAAPAKTLRTESSRSASATGLMLIFFLMMAVAIIASIIACVEGKRHDGIRTEDSQMGSLAAHKYPPSDHIA